MTRGRGLTLGVVALVAAVVTLLSTVLWMFLTRGGDLVPAPSWLSIATLPVLGGLVLGFARPVRAHVRRTSGRALDPIRAARTVVLAQAAALTGSAVFGWYVGQLVNLLRDWDLVANRPSTWRVGIALVAALVLVVAGLLAQAWCRVPPQEPDRDRRGESVKPSREDG